MRRNVRSDHPIAAILEARGILHHRFAALLDLDPPLDGPALSHILAGRRKPADEDKFYARCAALLGVPEPMIRPAESDAREAAQAA